MKNFKLTELNIAVRVRRVVIPIPTLPGTDSAEINRDSQARILTMTMMMMTIILIKTYSPQTQQKVYRSGLHDIQSAWLDATEQEKNYNLSVCMT